MERYSLQSVARLALPGERVGKCLRIRYDETIQVQKHITTQKAFYSGLVLCGSVWHCPVCAAKISERRRNELKLAFEQHTQAGGHIAHLTLTFSHKKKDKLSEILLKFSQATNRFFSGKRYQLVRDRMDLIGRIRAFEVTYSETNGFHPHVHVALFHFNKMDYKILQAELYSLWSISCLSAGLTASERHGLILQQGEDADQYLGKDDTVTSWDLPQELSKSHIKKGRAESMTPFDFLRNYRITNDKKYLNLFHEYAKCFKGKRQIQWSPGLKKLYSIAEKTDEQLATEQLEKADLLGTLNDFEWKIILKHDFRAQFLTICEGDKDKMTGDEFEVAKNFLQYLRSVDLVKDSEKEEVKEAVRFENYAKEKEALESFYRKFEVS